MKKITLDFETEQDYQMFQTMLGRGMIEILNKKVSKLYGGPKKVLDLYGSITGQLPSLPDNEK